MKKELEDYQFRLSINRRGQINTICYRFFNLEHGLREDIDEATEECVDLIYDDIMSKEKPLKVEKDYDISFIFSLYYKKELMSEIEYMLPDNRQYSNINIKSIIPDIINIIRIK